MWNIRLYLYLYLSLFMFWAFCVPLIQSFYQDVLWLNLDISLYLPFCHSKTHSASTFVIISVRYAMLISHSATKCFCWTSMSLEITIAHNSHVSLPQNSAVVGAWNNVLAQKLQRHKLPTWGTYAKEIVKIVGCSWKKFVFIFSCVYIS